MIVIKDNAIPFGRAIVGAGKKRVNNARAVKAIHMDNLSHHFNKMSMAGRGLVTQTNTTVVKRKPINFL